MLLPLYMTNSGVLLFIFLPIMCPPHLLPFPYWLSQMTFYYLSFYINPIIETALHNIILQLLCYISLDILFQSLTLYFFMLDTMKLHTVT